MDVAVGLNLRLTQPDGYYGRVVSWPQAGRLREVAGKEPLGGSA